MTQTVLFTQLVATYSSTIQAHEGLQKDTMRPQLKSPKIDTFDLQAEKAASPSGGSTPSEERSREIQKDKALDPSMRSNQLPVPTKLSEAVAVFIRHPTALCLLAGIAVTSAARVRYAWTLADLLVIPLMLAVFFSGEYFVHAIVLHSKLETFSFLKEAHKAHHHQPFHCISIESVDSVPAAVAIVGAICFAIFGWSCVTLTAFLTTLLMGLAFTWIHFLVHTRVPLRSRVWCALKRAHIVHHLRDDQKGLSITNPVVDWLMGTDVTRR